MISTWNDYTTTYFLNRKKHKYSTLQGTILAVNGKQVAQMVKNTAAMQETWVWPLNWEDPLEKRMTTHSSILAWRIPWIEEPCGIQSMRLQRVGHDWATNTFTFFMGDRKKVESKKVPKQSYNLNTPSYLHPLSQKSMLLQILSRIR